MGLKTIELNPDSIYVVGSGSTEGWEAFEEERRFSEAMGRRHIVAWSGDITFTSDPSKVDHARGVFMKIASQELEDLLNSRATLSLAIRMLVQRWHGRAIDRMEASLNPERLLDPQNHSGAASKRQAERMAKDHAWFCRRICGQEAGDRDGDGDGDGVAGAGVAPLDRDSRAQLQFHSDFEGKKFVKYYEISKAAAGRVDGSTKAEYESGTTKTGKPLQTTRVKNFDLM